MGQASLFSMKGAWSGWMSLLYEAVVARAAGRLYERLADEIDPRLPQGAAVVDVGCGVGLLAATIAKRRPDAHIVGVDLSPTMIERARKHGAALSNLRFETGNACSLPFRDEEFDAAVSTASIKHWPDPARGVAEMARVVRPGGRVLVLEADPHCTHETARRFVSLWAWIPPGAESLAIAYFLRYVAAQGIDAATLAGFLRDAGITDIETPDGQGFPAAIATGFKP